MNARRIGPGGEPGPELGPEATRLLERLDRQADAAMRAPLPETPVLSTTKENTMLRRLLGYTPPAGPADRSPLGALAVPVVFTAHDLEPGDRYEATFEVWGKYQRTAAWRGHSTVTVRPDGTIRFEIALSELRQYRPNVRLVRVWLRPPGSPVSAPPSTDRSGKTLWAETKFPGTY